MKTNNITKKSLLMTMVLALSSVFASTKHPPMAAAPNGYVGGGSPIFISRPTRFKGYMRENRRFNSFNKKGR